MDIIECIQKRVNRILKDKYKSDDCPPVFTVSLIQRYNDEGKINQHEIGLTVQHLGQTYTRTIFPLVHSHYGYPDLEQEMEWLYNNTM